MMGRQRATTVLKRVTRITIRKKLVIDSTLRKNVPFFKTSQWSVCHTTKEEQEANAPLDRGAATCYHTFFAIWTSVTCHPRSKKKVCVHTLSCPFFHLMMSFHSHSKHSSSFSFQVGRHKHHSSALAPGFKMTYGRLIKSIVVLLLLLLVGTAFRSVAKWSKSSFCC